MSRDQPQHVLPRKRKARSAITKRAQTEAVVKNYADQYQARRRKQGANFSKLKP